MWKRSLCALGRKKAGEMNKTEDAYAKHLEELKHKGEIIDYWFERVSLKLGPNCRYLPDFMVLLSDMHLEFHEVKGSKAIFADDAKVKVKTAADLFPFPIKVIYPIPKKHGGGWTTEDYIEWSA